MSEGLKKGLAVGAFVLATIGFGTALYFMFFRAAPTPITAVNNEVTPGPGGLPVANVGTPTTEPGEEQAPPALPVSEVADGGLTRTTALTQTSVEGATLSADGSGMNYYDPNDGRFYTVTADGEIKALSTARFPEAETVVWNNEASKVVVEFPDGANVVYDFDTQTQVTIPSHWEEFDFSDSDEIIAKSIGTDPNNRWLIVADADGSGAQNVQQLGLNEDKVEVDVSSSGHVVAFSRTGTVQTGFGRQQILPIGQNNENFKGLVVEGINFHSIWSPAGTRLLYDDTSTLSDNKPLLWVVDASANDMGENRRSLGINTWSDKCTFTSETVIYCAVPVGMNANAGLQRALFDTLPDVVYKIDLASGRKSIVGQPETATPMSNLTVASDGSALFYTDSFGVLQMMKLQ